MINSELAQQLRHVSFDASRQKKLAEFLYFVAQKTEICPFLKKANFKLGGEENITDSRYQI